jgi:hypothetical protein
LLCFEVLLLSKVFVKELENGVDWVNVDFSKFWGSKDLLV